MKRSRFLVLHLPTLPTDRRRRGDPTLVDRALATWGTQGNRRLLMAVDAPGTTLHAGQALADAQAMHPDLVLCPAEPAAERAFLERLGLWALRFTPLVATDFPETLVLDIAGCTAPHGGEAELLARVVEGMRRGGVRARAVVADVVDGAAALARAGRHGLVTGPGDERGLVERLPLTMLRLSADCLAGLRRLGLQRVGDVLRQPRAPLSRRFGRELLDVLDSAIGDRPRTMVPVRAPAEFSVAQDYLDPIVTRPGIDLAVGRLLQRLCADLAGAGRGARRVTLRAFRVDGDVQELTVGTGMPTRTPMHLQRLFAQVLEQLEPDLGFERIGLGAVETNLLASGQDSLGTTDDGVGQDHLMLGELLDRLGQRLSVCRFAPDESHWPERAVRPVDPFAIVGRDGRWPGQEHPVRLLPRPVPVMVVATVPDGPPLQVRVDSAVHPVVWHDGPDRLDAEWWREAEGRPGRDYYRVALGNGCRVWLGRAAGRRSDQPPRWFLHGYLA